MDEIDRHKNEINKLEMFYKRERSNLRETFNADRQQRDSGISELRAEN